MAMALMVTRKRITSRASVKVARLCESVLDARLREISTRSREEFRRVLARGAMLF
jgi:hypothetical protein